MLKFQTIYCVAYKTIGVYSHNSSDAILRNKNYAFILHREIRFKKQTRFLFLTYARLSLIFFKELPELKWYFLEIRDLFIFSSDSIADSIADPIYTTYTKRTAFRAFGHCYLHGWSPWLRHLLPKKCAHGQSQAKC